MSTSIITHSQAPKPWSAETLGVPGLRIRAARSSRGARSSREAGGTTTRVGPVDWLGRLFRTIQSLLPRVTSQRQALLELARVYEEQSAESALRSDSVLAGVQRAAAAALRDAASR